MQQKKRACYYWREYELKLILDIHTYVYCAEGDKFWQTLAHGPVRISMWVQGSMRVVRRLDPISYWNVILPNENNLFTYIEGTHSRQSL